MIFSVVIVVAFLDALWLILYSFRFDLILINFVHVRELIRRLKLIHKVKLFSFISFIFLEFFFRMVISFGAAAATITVAATFAAAIAAAAAVATTTSNTTTIAIRYACFA